MISFCHYGNESMASYRYRARIPAQELGADINNPDADVIIFAKPRDVDVVHVNEAKRSGKKVIADFCDMHFNKPYYNAILNAADAVTVPTQWFADYLAEEYGIEAFVVPDPYEFAEVLPHCNGDKLLWFGQGANLPSLQRIFTQIVGHPLAIVSNVPGTIPWSIEALSHYLIDADIVLMPETAPYKSPNRTIEAIRNGCFVVAEPHPAINDIPGIWLGNIKEGIEWAQKNLDEANKRTAEAQNFVRRRYSPKTQACAWRTVIQKVLSCSTSGPAIFTGTDG